MILGILSKDLNYSPKLFAFFFSLDIGGNSTIFLGKASRHEGGYL
eukprot:SAG31_NODE_39616_length_287_cov_0.553191_1_plen_44_part_01